MSAGSKKTEKWVVSLLVSVLIATALLPTIFSNLNTMESDTTNFSTVEIAIISVIGILIIVGFLYKVMKSSGV
ncbi:unnamed protein product [marine sediment metagenome]|uniref:Uncharacterized protein n=1 Tax=marine sediment metagenome TaxID=412755 RepID=X0WTX3_9ZZZZ